MDLSAWMKYRRLEEKRLAARLAGVSYRHLLNVARGDAPAGYALCLALEPATCFAVSRHDLRPDLFSKRGCECHTCAGPIEEDNPYAAQERDQPGHVQ